MRTLTFYKTYFQDFYNELDERAQDKIEYAFSVLLTQNFVSQKFVKHISGSSDIYELRATVGSNEYRILFFFESGSLVEGGKIVIVGNGFLKKSDRDYRRAVELAEKIKIQYFTEKDQVEPNADTPV